MQAWSRGGAVFDGVSIQRHVFSNTFFLMMIIVTFLFSKRYISNKKVELWRFLTIKTSRFYEEKFLSFFFLETISF